MFTKSPRSVETLTFLVFFIYISVQAVIFKTSTHNEWQISVQRGGKGGSD